MNITRSVVLATALSTVLACAAVPAAHAEPDRAAAATPLSAGALFVPMAPTRVLDTRQSQPVTYVLDLPLTDHVPTEAIAVVFNLTGTGSTSSTYVGVTPMGEWAEPVSNLNLAVGETRANLVTATIGGPDHWRGVRFQVGNGSVHLIADIAGYYIPGTGAKFTPKPPERVLDTRQGGGAPVGPGATVSLDLAGKVPANASSAVFNLTGTQATQPTFVTAYPQGETRPTASNLNLVAGQTSPNLVTVKLGPGQKVELYNNNGSTHLIADLAGFYAADAQNVYYPLVPTRILDTRDINQQSVAPVPAGGSIPVTFGHWLPANAKAAVFNLTGTKTTATTFVSAWPTGSPRPVVSNLNLTAGQTAPNLAIVTLAADSRIDLYNNAGKVDLLADLAGYFAPSSAACVADCVVAWGDNKFAELGNGSSGFDHAKPGPVYGLSGVKAVAGTEHNGYALKSDGTVWVWGRSSAGEVDGAGHQVPVPSWVETYEPAPVKVANLTGVVEIAAGYAIKADRTLWAWGWNLNWRLGTGSTALTAPVAQVVGLTDVKQVVAARDNGYALKGDGTVWAWGNNGHGQLGNGADPGPNPCYSSDSGWNCGSAVPVQVSNLTGVVSIGAREGGGMAVKSDGTVWSWGWNDLHGELGNGTECELVPGPGGYPSAGPGCKSHLPVQVTGLTGVKSVAGFEKGAYALKTDGTVWSWGYGHMGELGNGKHCYQTGPDLSPCVSKTPVQVSDLTGVDLLVSRHGTAFARKTDGTVWAWGDNTGGQIPGNLSHPVATAVQIPGLAGVTGLAPDGYAIVPAV